MTAPAPESLAREVLALAEKATPGPWKFYHPAEFQRDWRVARDAPSGELGPGTRDYICRITTSHDPKMSGNGGRALNMPLEADVRMMCHARTAAPELARAVLAMAEERERILDREVILRTELAVLEIQARNAGKYEAEASIRAALDYQPALAQPDAP